MASESGNNNTIKNRISWIEINRFNTIQTKLLSKLENNKKYLDSVTDLISKYFGIDRETIKSKNRTGEVVIARGFIIYFLYKNLYRKLPNETLIQRLIGTYLARDRITIRYHYKQMKFLIHNDREYKQHHFNLYIKLVSYDII